MIMTMAPDKKVAAAISDRLLEGRLAACVQLMKECDSTYRWKGKTESATEFPVLAKTTEGCAQKAMEAIRKIHPYDVPEIIVLPIAGGDPGYLAWIEKECAR